MAIIPYPPPPPPPAGIVTDLHVWALRIVDSIRSLLEGHLNALGEVTLADGAGTTVLTDPRISPSSIIVFAPTTGNAAAESLWVSAQTTGEAMITHANAPTTDRTFRYLVIS